MPQSRDMLRAMSARKASTRPQLALLPRTSALSAAQENTTALRRKWPQLNPPAQNVLSVSIALTLVREMTARAKHVRRESMALPQAQIARGTAPPVMQANMALRQVNPPLPHVPIVQQAHIRKVLVKLGAASALAEKSTRPRAPRRRELVRIAQRESSELNQERMRHLTVAIASLVHTATWLERMRRMLARSVILVNTRLPTGCQIVFLVRGLRITLFREPAVVMIALTTQTVTQPTVITLVA